MAVLIHRDPEPVWNIAATTYMGKLVCLLQHALAVSCFTL